MATASSNRLDQWLTQAYGIIGDIQSIATGTAGATANPNAAAAETNPTNTWWTQSSTYSDPYWTSSADPWASSSSATQTTSAPSSTTHSSSAKSTSAKTSPSQTKAQAPSTKSTGTATPTSSGRPSNTSAASASTSSGTAVTKAHKGGNNNLPIILGVVLGLLALICLILGAWWFLRRRRRRRSTTPTVLDDEDEGSTWRRDGAAHEPMMGTTATAWAGTDTSYNAHPPQMTQHPAYRGLETGSTNPFVPPVPAPRRAIQTPSPVLAKETSPIGPDPPASNGPVPANNQNITNGAAAVPNSPTETSPVHTRNPFTTGITALAAGVAANKIKRKPVNSHSSSDYSSPTDESAVSGWNQPAEDGPANYGHTRNPSSQPLMSGGQPTNYTDERPPTPLGFMGFIKNATAARAAAANHDTPHDETVAHAHATASPDHSSNSNRPSYQSFTMRPGPNHYGEQVDSNMDGASTTRNGRRVSFNEPLEATTTPGSYRSHRSSSAIGFTDYEYPLPTTHRTDSPNGSGGSPGGSPHRYPHRYSNGSNGSGNGSPHRHSPLPSQAANGGVRDKRLRLSDLRAREEELERLREMDEGDNVHGWRGRDQYGYDPRLRQNGNGFGNGRRGGGDVGTAM